MIFVGQNVIYVFRQLVHEILFSCSLISDKNFTFCSVSLPPVYPILKQFY